MQVYLSTLIEMDYIGVLEKLEQHYTDNEGLDGESHSKIISNLRKQPTYDYELGVVVRKGNGDIIEHIMLSEVSPIDNEGTFEVLQSSSLVVTTPYRNQGIGETLVQAVEGRTKTHHYIAIIVDGCPDCFIALGYASVTQHHIILKDDDKLLYVKFLLDQLGEYPHEELGPIS